MKITVSMTHCRVLGHMNRIPPLREAMHPGSGLNLTTEEPVSRPEANESQEFITNDRSSENPPQLLGTADDHTITSPPPDEQDPASTAVISPAPSRYMANDAMETPFRQSVSVPRTSGFSGEIAPKRADSFKAAPESDDELCPSRQLET
ncbi:hypothetical protein J3459_022321 [Metarhizium acridum]|nr:hypothetical protein J3459_022321 [Metarhizium acridum]